ncbi:hypothetical protein P43SY_009214 [Pythium insidiosum]|uniref:CCHC-type domain-containing protein n=1 Tax=Pythium insidiosum TaxID=114742 RepID=A0AAD5Q241_PYTIN|nr:hypothetical protein P43SY_009214 [Pythium insidiosum]
MSNCTDDAKFVEYETCLRVRGASSLDKEPVEFVKIPDVGSCIIDRIRRLIDDPEVRLILLPVNFGNFRWCGVVVDVNAKRVRFYDPLNSSMYTKYNNEGIPKNWDGKDWLQYKWIMKNVFEEQDLWMHVNGSIKRESLSRNETEEDFDKKQLKIKRMIGMSVPSKILKQISTAATGAAMWEALCEVYGGKKNAVMRAHNIDRLLGELQHKKFKLGGDIQEHLSEMTTLRVELRDLQHEVQDVVYVRMLLNSLPADPEFEKVKGFVDYGDDNLLSKPDDVIMKIRMAATRQAERHKASKEARGHKSDSVKSDKKEDGDEKKKKYRKKCFNCGSTEHLKRDCQADSGQGKKGSDQKQSNYILYLKTMADQGMVLGMILTQRQERPFYIKNRVYCKATNTTPYEKMFGVRPDIHHIRTFGSLAYVHVAKTPNRPREVDNAKIGFVQGLREDIVGMLVYFPDENTKKWVSDVRLKEEILYRDRHAAHAVDSDIESWLHFSSEEQATDGVCEEPTMILQSAYEMDDDDAEIAATMLANAMKAMAHTASAGPAREKLAGMPSVPMPNTQQKRLKAILVSSPVKNGAPMLM